MSDLINVIDKTKHLQYSVNQAVNTSVDSLMVREVAADSQRSNTVKQSSGSMVGIVDKYVDRKQRKCNLLGHKLLVMIFKFIQT